MSTFKWRVRRVLSDLNIQIRRGPGIVEFLRSRDIDTVLDVGANVGQFGQGLRALGYQGRIVSFEPIDAVYRELEAVAARDHDWSARRLALGDVPGRNRINVSEATVFSSMLGLSEAAATFDQHSAVVRTEEIEVARLDDVFDEFAGRSVFLKVDTQGFEPAVLAGGARALSQIRGVQLELPIENLYTGSWDLEEAMATMRRAGFVPAQFAPVNHSTVDPASAIEFDCVFRRLD